MVRAHVKQTPEEKKESGKKKTPTVVKKKSVEAGSWPCKINGCNKIFAREADLKRHQRTTRSHSTMSCFSCPQCDATFTRTDALRRHQKSRHNGVIINPLQSYKDKEDGGPSRSRSSSRTKDPDKLGPLFSSNPKSNPKEQPAPKASTSYYRQHTMHPSYGAGRPPLPPHIPPPPMLYDPNYPPPIAMPTSAARLHPWTPVPSPWPPPPHASASSSTPAAPPASPTPATSATDEGASSEAPGTAAVTQSSPAPSASPASPPAPPPPQPYPPPPPGAMYRLPPPYYSYYPHAPFYPYPPPPPEYFAHYGMHPGMPMPPYMMPSMPGPMPPMPHPGAPQPAHSASASSAASSHGSDDEADGEDDDEVEKASSPAADVSNSVIDPLLTSETAMDADRAQRTSIQEQENSTLQAAQAAKVVEVLLKYQSEKNKENAASAPAERMLDIPPPILPMDAASTSEDSAMPQVVPQMAPESDEPVGVHMDGAVPTIDPESMFDPPMLNADELLTQESLASPPPPS